MVKRFPPRVVVRKDIRTGDIEVEMGVGLSQDEKLLFMGLGYEVQICRNNTSKTYRREMDLAGLDLRGEGNHARLVD